MAGSVAAGTTAVTAAMERVVAERAVVEPVARAADDLESVCVVCYEGKRSHALIPCGHMYASNERTKSLPTWTHPPHRYLPRTEAVAHNRR